MKIVAKNAAKSRTKEVKENPVSLGERLKNARIKKNITQAELASAVGIKQQAVQRIESGKVKSTGYIVQLARVLTVTPQWLALGEESAANVAQETATYHATGAIMKLPLLQWDETKLIEQLPLNNPTKTVSVIGGPKCFALQVKDNSMISSRAEESSFYKNDFIIVDPTKAAKNHDFVVAKFPDSAQMAFRQLVQDEHGNSLKALNTHYSSTKLSSAIKICGVVIGRYSELV